MLPRTTARSPPSQVIGAYALFPIVPSDADRHHHSVRSARRSLRPWRGTTDRRAGFIANLTFAPAPAGHFFVCHVRSAAQVECPRNRSPARLLQPIVPYHRVSFFRGKHLLGKGG